MCGRFRLSTASDILEQQFGIDVRPLPELGPRYNIAPTQPVVVVRAADDGSSRELAVARWGLVPWWAGDAGMGSRLINARSETAAVKPAFRDAFRCRRCILPADGFYEWGKEGPHKQPHLFRDREGRTLGLAGLWERWRSPDGDLLETCTILTTAANATVRPLHDRMPAILSPCSYAAWLDPRQRDRAALTGLLLPAPEHDLICVRVGPRVNSPAEDDPGLIDPLQ